MTTIPSPLARIGSLFPSLTRALFLGSALGLASPASLEAANNPEKEAAAVKFARDSHSTIIQSLNKNNPPSSKLWSQLAVAMEAGDNTLIEDLIPIRKEIIQKGATNPDIPPWMVHTALYTTAVQAQELPKQIEKNNKEIESLSKKLVPSIPETEKAKLTEGINKLKEENKLLERQKGKLAEMVSDIRPFLGKVIADTTTVGDLKEVIRKRNLLYPSEIEEFKKSNPTGIIYETDTNNKFEELAAYVIASIIDTKSINEAGEILINTNNPNTASAYWPIFLYLDSNTKIPETVLEKARIDTFGHEQLKVYREALKSKSPMSLSTPGIPSKAKPGSLEALPKGLQPFPLSPYQHHKKPEDQELTARKTLMRSRQGDITALPEAAQWFGSKHYSGGAETGSYSTFKRADYIMLQVIAEEAAKKNERGKLAFEVLGQVIASFPGFAIDVVIGDGSKELRDIPLRSAHTTVKEILNANPIEARNLIQGIAEKDGKVAKLIWGPPTSEEDIKIVDSIKSNGQRYALKTMAYLSEPDTFRGYFLRVAQNPFMDEGPVLHTALSAIALSENNTPETLKHFLDLGLDETKSPSTRMVSLYALLKATSINPMESEIQKRFPGTGPFTFRNSHYYLPDEKLKESPSPFLAYAMGRHNNFLKEYKQASDNVARTGGQPLTLTEATKLLMLINAEKSESPGTDKKLIDLVSDKSTQEKYIPQMVCYLKSCKGTDRLDTNIAIPIIRMLGKWGAGKEILKDIIENTDAYVKPASGGAMDALAKSGIVAITTFVAIENIEKSIDLNNPNDEAAEVLHDQTARGGSLFEIAALKALTNLGNRYKEKIKSLPDGIEKSNLIKARTTHAKKTFEHMELRELGLWNENKHDSDIAVQEIKYAQAADLLGGRKTLLAHLDSEILKINNNPKIDELRMPRKQFVRSYMQALFTNGYNPAIDNPALGFNGDANIRLQKLFPYIINEEFVRGEIPINPEAGKGIGTAIVDVAYISPGVLNNVNYLFPHQIRSTDFLEQHSLNVASVVQKYTPGISLLSCNVNSSLPEERFRPAWHDNPIPRIFEEIGQRNITGESKIRTINASFSWDHSLQNSPDWQNKYFSFLAAQKDFLASIGLVSFNVSTGNTHDSSPQNYGFVFTSQLGTLNNLGTYGDGSMAEATNLVAAMDGFPLIPELAPFSSRGKPSRKENKPLEERITSFQGVRVPVKTVENGKVVYKFVNGTSFAAPHKTALDNEILSLRDKKGLKPFSPSELRAYYSQFTKKIPLRRDFEGGNYPDIPELRRDLYSDQITKQKVLQKK